MRILVTGATSLLGRTVVEQLVARGDDVTVFQRHASGIDVDEVLGDIAHADAIERAAAGVDGVVHLAARVGVAGVWKEFERTNIMGTTNVITAARKAGASRFVHVSSPAVAHAGHSLVGAGASPAKPTSARGPYARSKAFAEHVALAANSTDMAVVAVRPHLVWGPGDTQLVGRIVERARQGRLAIVGTGASLIDSTYIDNAADALVAALDRSHDIGGRALVVSNGQPRPVRELINRIVLAAGLQPPRLRVPYRVARGGGVVLEKVWDRQGRTDDPPMTSFLAEQLGTAHWFDQRETRAALAWTPAVTLEEGFARLAASFQGS
ncbi:MAG: NAD-dependent epimerase/dehydratase family protein [Acidimicrobiia bacterium]|nr:MAG: NAD-dependent epimerase/dehydratase family protein [Acidimicrobiia bacterium]